MLSNVYLHGFDDRLRQAGFALTRYADDWVIICRSKVEAELASARAVLEGDLKLRLHPEKTRIVHITQGFEFLGYKIGRGRGHRFKAAGPSLYAIPRERSIRRFKHRVRAITSGLISRSLADMLAELNPVVRGWGNYYRRAHVRRLFNRLNGWILRRVWSWKYKRWRNAGSLKLPAPKFYGGLGLVNLLKLIPSMASYYRQKGYLR